MPPCAWLRSGHPRLLGPRGPGRPRPGRRHPHARGRRPLRIRPAQAADTEPEARATQTSGITGEQWMDAQHDRTTALLVQGRLPHFASVAAEADLSSASLFAFGLTTLLDGLAARIESAPAARGAPIAPSRTDG
ncbi:TetR/AcrR family transcriptional regulator C-terminal domain-containing protein [Streptomyces sp. NPDC017890]|uniref:TetR/AcrR family transcriptional regulator C-terminal domain-containing protein n=1 Tax=Streptomyces sp. NPDC017890 TaxID=3365015 RepID=UPI0037BE041E